MYTTQNNRQIERQLDREVGVVARDRCIQHKTIEREIERQLDREEEEEVGTNRRIQNRTNDRQRERQLDTEEGEVATYRQMYTT